MDKVKTISVMTSRLVVALSYAIMTVLMAFIAWEVFRYVPHNVCGGWATRWISAVFVVFFVFLTVAAFIEWLRPRS